MTNLDGGLEDVRDPISKSIYSTGKEKGIQLKSEGTGD